MSLSAGDARYSPRPGYFPRHGRVYLTVREREVLILIGRGWECKEVAKRLGIAHATVRNLLLSAFTRLGVRNSHHAVAVAVQERFLCAADLMLDLPRREERE